MFFAICITLLILRPVVAANPVSPGEKALIEQLPKTLSTSKTIHTEPLIDATKEAIRLHRDLVPQIAGAAVRRAENCSTVEQIVRVAMRGLQPTPTPLEFFAITQAAVGNARENLATQGCTETILTTASSEYPQYVAVLYDSGKQVSGKEIADKQPIEDKAVNQPEQQEPFGQEPEPGNPIRLTMPPFPIAVTIPGNNLNPPITPIY